MTVFGRGGAAAGRRGTPADLLVVGLGNPGPDYASSRHNVGAEAVARLATRHGGSLRRSRGERALADTVQIDGKRVALAFPQTFMNLSGESVVQLVRRHGITDPSHLVVVHDELDLPLGKLKVKRGGGLAGHNGLRSIKAHLHTDEFVRVRIGIGKPPGGKDNGADHVLRRPSKATRTELDVSVEEAADAVELILSEGVDAAMNRVNTRTAPD
ncbi:MAG TPA: aminoacyl-tRNA hydrolase [Acidimicrobiales bacterium]|nr:aminoacyl-tRNA hydrolase [Acidimicrobiales bacterium]